MPKSVRNRSATADAQQGKAKSLFGAGKKSFDPALTSLFASSLGPVTAPPKSRYQPLPERKDEDELSEAEEELDYDDEGEDEEADEEDDTENSSSDEAQSDDGSESEHEEIEAEGSDVTDDDDDEESSDEKSQSDNEAVLARIRETVLNGEEERPNKKRKRGNKDAEVEDVYLQKLAREEAKDEEKRNKKQKTVKALGSDDDDASSDSDSDSDGESYEIPKHETQTDAKDNTNDDELEKASRTVFLGNVSSEAITSKAAKKTLLRHLGSFFDDLADNKPPHKVESLRFRSTAFASALPKKAAFSKKEILDATTKSTNAYAVYSTQLAAREAVKQLNGTVVLNRHLRVDSVAHPAKVDNRRCVFVGNLGFVDDESKLAPEEADAEEGGQKKKNKNKPPSDVEEGLWVQFSKAGKVESVRVVRDPKTRVGKGIAYVQFEDENGVEAALQFNDQKFPPMLPRKLRVVRAKAPKKKKSNDNSNKKATPTAAKPGPGKPIYAPKVTPEQKSAQGRARAMLGKAGAFKTAESFVFEGHRASSKNGKAGLKLGGGKKKNKSGKPTTRSSRRGAAWKSGGGRK